MILRGKIRFSVPLTKKGKNQRFYPPLIFGRGNIHLRDQGQENGRRKL